jgi:iron-sulfur cluster insertion protein
MEIAEKGLRLSEAAARALEKHLEGSQAECLRVSVQGGGCSGFEYRLFLDHQKEEDQAFESHGQKIICDPVSFSFVDGSEIDYSDGLQDAGFVVHNPRAIGACGCGSSFYV